MDVFEELQAACDFKLDCDDIDVAVGLVIRLASEYPAGAGIDAVVLANLVSMAFNTGNLHLYFDRFGKLEGYAILAVLDQTTYARFVRGELAHADFRVSGPNGHACVIDFFGTKSATRRMLAKLKKHAKRKFDDLTYFRIKSNKRICRRIRFA